MLSSGSLETNISFSVCMLAVKYHIQIFILIYKEAGVLSENETWFCSHLSVLQTRHFRSVSKTELLRVYRVIFSEVGDVNLP